MNKEEMVELVREMLWRIQRRASNLGHPGGFYGLPLITAKGRYFVLSIQGSTYHYCEPRETLRSLLDYSDVEVGIIPDERNTGRFKFGTTFDFETGKRVLASRRSWHAKRHWFQAHEGQRV